jgi:hypothetical protein
MAKKLEQIIEQADELIQQKKFDQAWKLLLPYYKDTVARKRLKWLKAKRTQLKQEKVVKQKPATIQKSGSQTHLPCYTNAVIIAIIFVCAIFVLLIFMPKTETESSKTETESSNNEAFSSRILYVRGTVRARNCASIDCPVVDILYYGETVTVTGRLTGETDSAIWYQLSTGSFVPSETLTASAPPTAAPPQQSYDSSSTGSNSSSNNQSQAPVQQQTNWNCNGNNYNCGDFKTCSDMRSYWNACRGDPSNLDYDNDGSPCEDRCGR